MSDERDFRRLAEVQHAWFEARGLVSACNRLLSHLADECQEQSLQYTQIEIVRAVQANKARALYQEMAPGETEPE